MEDEDRVEILVHDVLRACAQVRLDAFCILRPLHALGDRRLDDVRQDEGVPALFIVEEGLRQELADEAGGSGDQDTHSGALPGTIVD